MKYIDGDIIAMAINSEMDVLVHGCNCFHTMGAGVARQVKTTWPEALAADRRTPHAAVSKLGTYSSYYDTSINVTIINAYTQYDFRGSTPRVNYQAVEDVFQQIAKDFPNHRIRFPLIGAGLAGGDWHLISNIIDSKLKGLDYAAVRFRMADTRN